MSLSAASATLSLKGKADMPAHRLTMILAGGRREAGARPRRALAGVSNYLLGNDPARWVRGVRGYGEIEYRDVYPGVDVVYYGNQQQLEYDFVVAPGSSPDAIALKFEGASGLRLNDGGDLVIATAGGEVVQKRPVIYQSVRGARRIVRGGYVLRQDDSVGFEVGNYDRALPLVIDPVLSYATYLGGTGFERVGGVALDAAGNVLVAGTTPSADFPVVTPLPSQPNGADVFVAKLSPAGDALLYSTYLGGFGYDTPSGLAVDVDGSAYLSGRTDSGNFPATNRIGPRFGGSNAFVVKLDGAGSLVYSTLLGGGDEDYANAIAVDAHGRARIVGSTISADFPVVNALQPQLGGSAAFHSTDGAQSWTASSSGLKTAAVAAFAFDPAPAGTVYATTTNDGVFRSQDAGITWNRLSLPAQPFGTMTAQGNAMFLAGAIGVYRSVDHGDTWLNVDPTLSFVTSVAATSGPSAALYAGRELGGLFRSNDQGLSWSDAGLHGSIRYLATSGDTVYAGAYFDVWRSMPDGSWVRANLRVHDPITALAVDSNNPQVAYVGTYSGLWKTVSGGVDWFPIAGFDTAYIAAIAVAPTDPSTIFVSSSSGSVLSHDAGQTWAPAGLAPNTWPTAVAFDPRDSRNIYVGTSLAWDAFLTTLSADGSSLEFSTFIGGRGSEMGYGVAVDASGDTYVSGETSSTDFPTANPIQPGLQGFWDAFVVKLSAQGAPVYSTYLGGSGTEFGGRLAVDTGGRAYITGNTWSADFPLVNPAQGSSGGAANGDVFVTALNPSGSAFVYSTYLGGSDYENPQGITPSIAVSPSGEAAVIGATRSTDFPATANAVQRSPGGSDDAFLARFDAAGALLDATFLGRSGADYGQAIAVDSNGVAVVAGYTNSVGWATAGVVQSVLRGSDDAFVVKIVPGDPPPDTTAPTTTIALSGSAGMPGWFSSPVTVFLSASDNDFGSGVAYIEYSLNGGAFQRYTGPVVIAAAGTTQLAARASDWAGNVENPPPSRSVTIDATAPAIGFTLAGTAGADGWFRSAVTVSLSAADPAPGTGVVSTQYRIGNGTFQPYTSSIVVSAAGITQVTARATDANGNVATSTREVKIDTAPPQTTIAIAGTSGLAGWYRSAVTVSLSANDNASGVAGGGIAYRINDGPFQPYTTPFVVAAEGATRITARATDRAGNVESAPPVSPFMIDLSAPAITIASPQARDYLHSEEMPVSFAATDTLSGVQTVAAALDRFTVPDGFSAPLRLIPLGPYTFTVTATDSAGNVATKSVSLRIVATIDSLAALVRLYRDEGHIAEATARSLLAKLDDARSLLERGNVTGAAGKVRDFISQCSSTTWRGIGVDTAALLIADAEYVLATLQ